jgi:hypothetical protein
MAGAVQVGALVINMAADVASLKTSLDEANREAKSSADKIAANFSAVRGSIESAITPLKTLTVNVGSLESNMARAQASAVSLGKGLLLGAAAGMSIDAISKKIMGVIDTMAHLKDVSEKTGSSVENLSKLKFFAKQTGSDIDSIATALGKMSKGMAGADNETKGAGLALKYLGISAKDAAGNLKDPAAVFTEVALKLGEYKDGAGKATIAQMLFGKAGADLLPTLKLMAEQGDIAAKVFDDQSTAARQYLRDMAKLDAMQGMLFKTIATALLPTMTDFAEVLLGASKNANVVNGAVKGLAEDKSLEDWADDAGMALAFLIDTFKLMPALFSTVASGFKDIFAIVKIADSLNPLTIMQTVAGGENPVEKFKAALADQEKAQMAYGDKLGALLNGEVDATQKAMQAKIDARRSEAGQAAAIVKKADADAKEATKKNLNINTGGEDGPLKTTAAIQKEAASYATLISAIKAKTAENRLELASAEPLTESQKTRIKLDEELKNGKVVLTAAHVTATRAALDEQAATEALVKAKKTEKDVSEYILQSTAARTASAAALSAEYALYGKSSDARDVAMIGIKNETEFEKFLSAERKAGAVITEDALTRMRAEVDLRTKVEQATMSQTKALAYATQLATENKRFAADAIFDEKARAAALLQIDADMWQQRIQLAGDGTEAQKKLQGEYETWYKNQLLKPQLEAEKTMWASIDSTAHDTFVSIFDSGKSAFDRLRDTLKNGLLDLLYQMTIKKWIFSIGAVVSGGAGGMAQAAGDISSGAGGASSLLSNFSSAGSLYTAYSSSSLGQFMSGYSGSAGTASEALGVPMTGAAQAGSYASAATPYVAGIGGGLAAYSVGQQYGAGAGIAAGAGTIAAGGALTGAMSGAAGATAMGGATAALAAVPVWGWIAIAALAILGGMQDGPEQATRLAFGSNNKAGAISINERGNEGKNDEYVAGVSSKGAFGTFGVTSTFWMEAAQPAVQSFVQTVTQTDDALAKFMTSTEQAATVTALTGHTMTSNSGAEGSDPNGMGGLDAVFADRIKTIFDTIDPSLNAMLDGFKGTSQELATEATALLDYRKNLPAASEAIFGAVVTLKDLAALRSPTEAVSAALTRVTNAFTATNSVIDPLGISAEKAFGAVGLASLDARQGLIDAAGGMSALNAGASNFAQNFLTDAQKLAPVVEALTKRMTDLGYAGVTTADGYKDAVLDLVSSGALATASGASTYVELLKLASSFKEVGDASAAADAKIASDKSAANAAAVSAAAAAASAAATASKEQRSLDIQLMTATGDAEGALAATRSDALAALLSDQARTTQAQIWAADEASAAIAKAQTAAQESATQMAAAEATIATKQAAARATQQAAEQAALQSVGNAFLDSMNAATSAAKALRDFNDSLKLGNLSALSKGQQYDEAKRQYAASPNDQAAATAFLTASKARGGAAIDYAKDFALVIASNSKAAAANEATAAAIPLMWRAFQSAQAMDGSHAGGLGYVPFDGYKAVVHEGEGILTKSENKAYRSGGGGVADEVRQMRTELASALHAIAANTSSGASHARKTSDILVRVTKDGKSLMTSPT